MTTQTTPIGIAHLTLLQVTVPPETPISVEVPNAMLQARLSPHEFATRNLRAVQALLTQI